MDLDWERDSLLHLLGFLIEVLAELPDGDSSLHGKQTWNKMTGLVKMYETSELENIQMSLCDTAPAECRCRRACQSLSDPQKGWNIFTRSSHI